MNLILGAAAFLLLTFCDEIHRAFGAWALTTAILGGGGIILFLAGAFAT